MAHRKFTRKTVRAYRGRRTRRYRARRSGGTKKLNRSTRSGPFPRSTVVSLRYVDNEATVNPAADSIATWSWRANSIFAPSLSGGTTHQPYGHDTLATVYLRYKVLSATITTYMYASATGGALSGVGAIQVSTEASPTTNATLRLEQPETTYKPIASLQSNKGVVVFKKTYKASRLFGARRNKDLTADMGTSPAELAYFHVSAQPATGSTDMGRIDLFTTITYKVLLTEPKALGQS